MNYQPPDGEIDIPDYGQSAIDKVRDELIAEAISSMDDILDDVRKAFGQHKDDLDELRNKINSLSPAKRAEEIEALSKQVEDWLKQRNDRWSSLGGKLGTIVRGGVKAWIGI